MAKYTFFATKKTSKLGSFVSSRFNNKISLIINNFISKNSNILEIGPGTGFLAKLLMESGFKYSCIEPQPILAATLRNTGVNVIEKVIPPLDLPINSLDAIIAVNVIEHLENNKQLQDLIQESFKILKSNGKIILIFPDIRYWKNDFYDGDYTHNLPLTLNNISQLLKDFNFNIICNEISFGFIHGILGSVINSFISNLAGTLYYFFPKSFKIMKAKVMFHGNSIIIAEKLK